METASAAAQDSQHERRRPALGKAWLLDNGPKKAACPVPGTVAHLRYQNLQAPPRLPKVRNAAPRNTEQPVVQELTATCRQRAAAACWLSPGSVVFCTSGSMSSGLWLMWMALRTACGRGRMSGRGWRSQTEARKGTRKGRER